ncbi:MAG: hypothetical protein HQM11_17405 [SAR324 cluster bacterium]|nr:hypothetical protein [SAR324 cluster bacterium]
MDNKVSQTRQAEDFLEWLDSDNLIKYMVILSPPKIPLTCFPEIVGGILKQVLSKEWSALSERARNYVSWMSSKAEAVDMLAPPPTGPATKGFELLAIDLHGRSFGGIMEQCKELNIPSVVIRFASLIVTFLTLRLLRKYIAINQDQVPSLMFTQNVDGNYLNYPMALKQILKLFPEHKNRFYLEINEYITEDYLNTIRTLSNELGIRLVLDDSNKMDSAVHWKLLDLADWIKIDFEATRTLEQLLIAGHGPQILEHYENYAKGAKSPVIVFEGLMEKSPLKPFFQENWKHPGTALYYQSRERLPIPPWDKYFGLLQDYKPEEFGLFFKGFDKMILSE